MSRVNGTTMGLIGGGVIVLIVIALVVVAVTGGSSPPATTASVTGPAPASVVQQVSTVPASVFNTVGIGATGNTAPAVLSGKPALKKGGLPEIIYVGAEYCPYCAAERWAMVVALSRFGTFANLKATESSTTDVFPGTKTFSFYGATYSSPYLVFDPTELCTNQHVANPQPACNPYGTLQAPSAQVASIDAADNPQGSIPFIDIGNRYTVISAQYTPGDLSGATLAEIAASLSHPTTTVAQDIIGSANYITAAICKITGGKPGSVCTSSGVKQATAKLP